MGAYRLSKSLMRLFVLVLFNSQCRSMVSFLKGTIRFDSLPLLQGIVTG